MTAAPFNQPSGQSLLPGTVTPANAWNRSLTCRTITAESQPLEPLSSWNETLSIPTQLFMGQPQGPSYVEQSYQVFLNRTFSASDNHGNAFSFTVPLPTSGLAHTTLVGNSTMAVLTTVMTTGHMTVADISLTFSTYDQSCQPAGVRFVISGTENWGPGRSGSVEIVFDKAPVSTGSTRAYFGNSSGAALGFDWSDSQSLDPAFDNASATLSYEVGSSFYIDPETVASLPGQQGLSYGYQGRVLYGDGYYWIFYYDGTNYEYRSSPDGITWGNASAITTAGVKGVAEYSAFISGDTVYFAATGQRTSTSLYYDTGTLGGGSIVWGAEEAVSVSWSPYNGPGSVDIAVDTNGNVWIAYLGCSSNCGGSGYRLRQLVYTNEGGSWALNLGVGSANNQGQGSGQLVPLTSGKMAFVYDQPSGPLPQPVEAQEWNGSSWTTAVHTQGDGYDEVSSFTSLGDTVVGILDSPSLNSPVYFEALPYGGPWTQTKIAGSGEDGGISAGPSSVTVFFWTTNDKLRYQTTTDFGSSWGPAQFITSPAKYETTNSAVDPAYASGALVAIAWSAGSSVPYSLEFTAVPAVIPDAATSADPWSKPGLSPYESYFNEFSDYVSPGNGLVSVEAGTLSLSGRGIDLASSLVYSEPYAFRPGGSPYLYDNYTGAALGYGWSLNFPWLGANYLHLADGQAFPYSWNGNTFRYNGVTNFVLTAGSGGTYTLTLASGTAYQFDSSKRLTSVTDSTGSNTISFSYGSNGYVSQVTDTIGRTAVFSYNRNNQLTSIASGGRTWTLGYSGNQLTSLTDPLSRITAFQYKAGSGAGAWLLTTVRWPTGGSVDYAYGSAPVGTEVSTYYATLRNVYYDPTHISLSQNISYATVNGQVTWSNTTVSDGTEARSSTSINFQPSKGVMTTYSYDGNGVLQQVTKTDSDAAGRTNATKTYSPAGALLSESIARYDDWGNVIYTNDTLGHQEWFSYANTNSSGAFGNSGCTASFYNQTVSSSIHDLLVGSCDYQDGAGSPQQQEYYEYDAVGNLIAQKTSHGGGWLYSNFTYDGYGNQISATTPAGVTTYYTYSPTYGHAYLTETDVADGAQDVATTYTYDLATGNELSGTNPDGYTTTYQYDALGRITQTTSPAVNGLYAVTKYSYDDTNNVLTTTGPDGHVTKAYFDGLARQTEIQQMNGTSAYSTVYYTYDWLDNVATKTTATNHTYTYSYDWDGRLTKLANPDGTYQTTSYNTTANTKTVTDENGHPTVYHYDRNQQLTSVKEYNSSSTYYLTTYAYDLSGNMLSSTDAKGQTTSYQYDDLNRLVKTTFPDGTFETKTYDAVGNLLTRTTANGSTISYAYDTLNRLVQVTYPGSGGSVTYTYDANGNRLSQVSPSATDYYSYDAMGRLTNQTEYVGGAKYSTLYAYDNASNVVQITYPDGYTLSMTYDALNRLKTVGALATLNYTADSQVSTIRYGDGETQSYAYDSRDRPTQIRVAYGGTVEMLLSYTYDGTGNVLTENSQTYSYDWLNRLTNSSGPWGTVSYAYDSVGNRVQTVNGSTTTDYAYGPFNRLLSAGNVNYTYDANGNLVTKSGGWAYSYDYENRLVNVKHNGVMVQSNSYDGDGNRVIQTVGTNSIVYSYQGVNILYQKNLTSGVVTKSFYAGGIQVAQMVGTTLYYLHQDALGSTRLVMPASMVSSFSSNYSPYGMNSGLTGSELFQYAGKLLDEATGLYYEGARYYDPTTGRFITEDSVVGSTSDPQSLNRYVYARDNPMKIVDMNGHEWWNPVADISAAATTVAGAVTNVANSVSNAWNSLPPDEKIGVIVLVSVVAVAATAGVASGAVAAIDAGTIGSILGAGAAMTGLPVIAMSTEDTGGLDANELAALSQGYRSSSVKNQLIRAEGLLGERFSNAQTGGINNGMDAVAAKNGLVITFSVPGGRVAPDGVDLSFNPPVVDQVKVGYWADKMEAMKYVDLVDTGQAQPGTFHFYQSPYNGKIGTSGPIWTALGDVGYDAVYTRGLWWKFPW